MINTLIQNTKTVTLRYRESDSVNLRFTELDGCIYIIMADLWPHLDHRNRDISDCLDDLSRAEFAFVGSEKGHIIADGTWGCSVEETEVAYLSLEAATLLAITVFPRPDGPLATIFRLGALERVFADVAKLYA